MKGLLPIAVLTGLLPLSVQPAHSTPLHLQFLPPCPSSFPLYDKTPIAYNGKEFFLTPLEPSPFCINRKGALSLASPKFLWGGDGQAYPSLWVDPLAMRAKPRLYKNKFQLYCASHASYPNVMLLTIKDLNDNIKLTRRIQSGEGDSYARSLPFPQSYLATHTEAKALRELPPLTATDRIEMQGVYPPCSACKGLMRKLSASSGVTIRYSWPPGSKLRMKNQQVYFFRGGNFTSSVENRLKK